MLFNIEEGNVGKRLDQVLPLIDTNISRTYAKVLIEEGNVLVNKNKQKASYKTKLDDIIDVYLPEAKALDVVAEKIDIDIIYEDDYLLIVNKEKGMVVHPANGNYEHTLVNAIMYHCKNSLSTINGVIRPGIVHRIDKDTSGLLVIAKDDVTHKNLAEQFKEHSNVRKYIAIVNGIIKQETGVINANIGRCKTDRKKMAVVEDGRSAITHFKVLEYLNNATVVECKLETGRTHQIRVHMAYIKHPLIGDLVYGNKNDKKYGNGQFLCATTLGFVHPHFNKYIEFNIDLPEYFVKEINRLRK